MKVLALSALAVAATQACTTILVGKKATIDQSLFTSHSNDGDANTDPRIVMVPAQTHAAGKKRNLYFSPEEYPRYVGTDRGDIPAYAPVDGQTPFEPIGQVDQPTQTYKYFEETYGAINEKQLGISESTCSCINWTPLGGNITKPCTSMSDTGCGRISIDEMSHIAMEQTATARAAVQLMGRLAEEQGFYGADGFEGSAESLLLADTEEAWIFHVLPHPSSTSAVWAAQRIPEDHVAVVANMFIIRNVNLTDSDNFYGSDLAGLAKEYGIEQFCKSNDACDFTRTYSDGEYAHKFYSGRRMWGVYRILVPDTVLPADYGNLKDDAPYPVSLPVDPRNTGHRIGADMVMKAMRDHYEGTKFDMTQGLASGPFGSPDRWTAGKGEQEVPGNWERSISIHRTSDSFVTQTNANTPDEMATLWFGPHAADTTVYTPFPIGMTQLPDSFVNGHQSTLDKSTAYWAIRYIHNLAQSKFSFMYPDIQAVQHSLENDSRSLYQKYVTLFAEAEGQTAQFLDNLTDDFAYNAQIMVDSYTQLFDDLMFKYADGYINFPNMGGSPGYPSWWLTAVDYPNGPPPIPEDSRIADTRRGRGVTRN